MHHCRKEVAVGTAVDGSLTKTIGSLALAHPHLRWLAVAEITDTPTTHGKEREAPLGQLTERPVPVAVPSPPVPPKDNLVVDGKSTKEGPGRHPWVSTPCRQVGPYSPRDTRVMHEVVRGKAGNVGELPLRVI